MNSMVFWVSQGVSLSSSRILAGLSALLKIHPDAISPASSIPALAKLAQGFSAL